MQRVSRWMVWLTAAMLLSLVAPAVFPAVPLFSAQAQEAVGPAAVGQADEEIILVDDTNGRILIHDPYAEAGAPAFSWTSGSDVGWNKIAAGDFNGDGDFEIVAHRGSTIKVFDPVVQTGVPQVVFELTLAANRPYRLLVTGDFDGDGRDEIATTTEIPSLPGETLRVYDGGAQGAAGSWSEVKAQDLDGAYRSLYSGAIRGINGAGGFPMDDLFLIQDGILLVYRGPNLAESDKRSFAFSGSWNTIAAGDLSTTFAGQELAMSRDGVGTTLDSIVYLRYNPSDGAFLDLTGGSKNKPAFQAAAAGDVNGDADDEVMFLRDPGGAATGLLMQNPSGAFVTSFEATIGYGGDAWTSVQMGDLDGDGRDETVILRGDRYRIYEDALHSPSYAAWSDVTGVFNPYWFAVANVDTGPYANPILSVSPTSLAMQGNYGQLLSSLVRVSNTGRQTGMNWTADVATADRTWLKVNGGSTAAGTAPANLTISADTVAANHVGTIIGTIRITGSAAGWVGQSVDVRVTLTTLDPGFMVTPSSLFMMEARDSGIHTLQLKLLKPSPGAVNWSATALPASALASAVEKIALGEAQVTAQQVEGIQLAPPPSWLTITPDQGSLQGEQTVVVSVQTNGATLGEHEAVILFVAQDSDLKNYVQWVPLRFIAATQVQHEFMPLVLR